MAKKKSVNGKVVKDRKVSKKVKKVSKNVKKVTREIVGKGKGIPTIVSKPMRKLVTEKDIAMDFAEKIHKRYDRLVKASILFGSQTKPEGPNPDSDIDIILIVDDAAVEWDMELVAWYREGLGKLIAAQKYAADLHVNTVKLTTWWQDMLHGDPVVINILRYGEALVDYGGFFNPLKALLLKGKVRSTPEAVNAALQRVPGHLARSQLSEMGAIEGAYWAMVDAAQAALMTAGKMPPSPEHIPQMMKETFVDAGMLKMGYIKSMQELFSLHKSISHRQLGAMKGQEIDEWQELAEKFLEEITKIITTLLEEADKK